MSAAENPRIDYPRPWTYRLIGRQALLVQAAIATILGTRRYVVSEGNRSSGGRYHSIELAVIVEDQAERDWIFQRLKAHEDVDWVL